MHKNMVNEKIKLNLGCGNSKIKGYINCDLYAKDVDKRFDLNKEFPFGNDSVDEIYTYGVVEHLDNTINFLKESYRILKPNGELIIEGIPHFSGCALYEGIDHKRAFSIKTFKYYSKQYPQYNFDTYYMGNIIFSTLKQKIVFGKKYAIWNYIIEPLANLFPTIYENTLLRNIFPAQNLKVVLIK